MDTRIQIIFTDGPASLESTPAASGQGAECIFHGTTRGERHPELGALEALEYELHEPMARTQLEEIATEILEEFDVETLRIAHARGRVALGETSVVIEARAAHRDSAFTACRAAIDRLKQRLPIFKVECWEHGTTRPEGVTPVPR